MCQNDRYKAFPLYTTMCFVGKKEPWTAMESVVTSLMAGPIAIGDAVGKANATLIKRFQII